MPNLAFEFAAQNLKCTETNSLSFDDVDFMSTNDLTHEPECENLFLKSDGSDESVLGLVPVQSEEILCLMFERERELLPRDDFLGRLRSGDLDLRVRREALDWIYKAHAHYRFGALSVCLATNYLDRFLSLYDLPSGKNWTVQLLAVSCLSLAAKLEEVNVPLTVDLQVGDPKFIFEAETIKRMELLVLSTLNWRMQACTPCSFIDYFLRNVSSREDTPPSESLICRSIQFMLNTNKDIDFLEFRPSEISAAVAIYVTREIQELDVDKAMSNIIHVEKVRVLKCVEMVQNLTLIIESSDNVVATTTAVPQSPAGVLDAACLSYKSDETCPNSSQSSPHTKRRKLD